MPGKGKREIYDAALLKRVALGFDVDERVVHNAIEKQPISLADFVERSERVRRGLEHELGGEETLKAWLKTENHGLDDERPIEFFKDGRIDVLERVEKALKGLQFG
ncbi:MAG: DUF2384 domain-containing protein [Candidatus Eremiobacteraeota bacterium]|nr:DUF2384 domain-containing protein [Candidatus Eremiobacteraeota bacterium]